MIDAITIINENLMLLVNAPEISVTALLLGTEMEQETLEVYMSSAQAAGVVAVVNLGKPRCYWFVIGDVEGWIKSQSDGLTIRSKICDYIRSNKGCRIKDLVAIGYNYYTARGVVHGLSARGSLNHVGGGRYTWDQRSMI